MQATLLQYDDEQELPRKDEKQDTAPQEQESCWQYKIRESYRDIDLMMLGLTEDEARELRTSDFEFRPLTKDREKEAARRFIRRYEWLGDSGMAPTHYFGTFYGNLLGGVVLMSQPNMVQNYFGRDVGKDIRAKMRDGSYESDELLIARGACAGWTPKNLASHLIMQCINWVVQHTQYRVFCCYADTEAHELGTIYQACKFYYLGDNFGARRKYLNPFTNNWVSDRTLRVPATYKHAAKHLKIEWHDDWVRGLNMAWENIPDDIEKKLRACINKIMREGEFFKTKLRHKYAFVKGRDKRETKQLRREFEAHTKTYPYPKTR